ncbi:SecDF P1 head subdomain-containing protein, partial [Neisseria sicca]|uniref:SecDF P1 head subdomain-containing protein n=1 Tax=Neisseria sicca TaxID=490 RepID=UPI003F689DA2
SGLEVLWSGGDDGERLVIKKEVELRGENMNEGEGSLEEMGGRGVSVRLDSGGGSILGELRGAKVGKGMGMVLTDQGKWEVVRGRVIRSGITGG